MSGFTETLILVLLFFVLLPVASVSSITVIRNIYRRIRGKSVLSLSKFITVFLVAIISLAIIPPIPYIISEAHASTSNVILTGRTAKIFYDKDYKKNEIRYIKFKGKVYQELIPSLSNIEYYNFSEDLSLEHGEPLANALDASQSLIEKYVCKVFRYPVNSQYIYPILNDGFTDYISLNTSDIFYSKEKIQEKIDYYSDLGNYNYFAEDYKTDKTYRVNVKKDVADEMLELLVQSEIIDSDMIVESIPGTSVIKDKTVYETIVITGETKDQLYIKDIGKIYIKKNKYYQIVGEEYHDDGTTDLYVFPLSQDTSTALETEFKKAGLIK